eukprot:GSMAST32.ASY1.ANO1.1660.1 assembled CDS
MYYSLKNYSISRKIVPALRLFCTTSSKTNAGPLAGIRVVDLTRVLAGPMCSQSLGDYGAEVWKVEIPGSGDHTRSWTPPATSEGTSTYFVGANRNKQSIAVDLNHSAGKKIIEDLVASADVLLENFLTGKMDEFGLGYENLSTINPRLIYCSISGYGASGPYATHPGYDVIVSGIGGLMGITGTKDTPCKTGVALIDQLTGVHAQAAISSALYSREKTGIGQKIEVSLLDTCVHSLANIGSSHLNASQMNNPSTKTAHESIVPYQAFDSSNGKMVIGAGNESQWIKLCSGLGNDGHKLLHNPKFNSKRVENRIELIKILSEIFSKKTISHWSNQFLGLIPFGPINSIADVFKDPQVIHNNLVHDTTESLKTIRSPVLLSKTPTSIRRPPPALGEHTEEILTTILGYSTEEVKHLERNGIVHT